MRILPVNNRQQNTSFRMLKVTDANTPELVQEAKGLLTSITPDGIDPPYCACDVSPREFLFFETVPDEYRAEGKNVFVFPREFERSPFASFSEHFKMLFENPKVVTMDELRKIKANFAEKIKAATEMKAVFERTQTAAREAWKETWGNLGVESMKDMHWDQAWSRLAVRRV